MNNSFDLLHNLTIKMPRFCIKCGVRAPIYNFPGEKRLYCADDKKEGMIAVVTKQCKICQSLNIRKAACFNYPDKITSEYCKDHAKDGMVNIKILRKGASKLRTTLAEGDPIVCKDWHPDNLKGPEEYSRGSSAKIWWKCHTCNHEWVAAISNRTGKNKRGCPVCANKVIASDASNSLKILYPRLAKEWSPLNKKGPECYTVGSGYIAWWQCPKRACHLYQATIGKRTNDNRNCPFCSHQRLCTTDYCNSLQQVYPKMAQQLHPSNPKQAHEYIAGGNARPLWQCLKNPEHLWTAKIASRITLDNDCPKCKRSKMERIFITWAKEASISFNDEVRIDTFIHKKKLPYDFLIPENILIEMDGRQHFDKSSYFSKIGDFTENVWKDLLKTWHAIKNGYFLIRVSYLDIDNIPTILDSLLEELDEIGLYYPKKSLTTIGEDIIRERTLVQKVYNIHASITANTTEKALEKLHEEILNLL